jgi:hypothetical protein
MMFQFNDIDTEDSSKIYHPPNPLDNTLNKGMIKESKMSGASISAKLLKGILYKLPCPFTP